MIKKRIVNLATCKEKQLDSWHISKLEKYITTSGQKYEDLVKTKKDFDERFYNLLSKYLLDEVTRRLHDEFPNMFMGASMILIDKDLLGIDTSVYKIELPASLLNIQLRGKEFPLGNGYSFSITGEILSRFSKEDLEYIKECAYRVFEACYNVEKQKYDNDGTRLLYKIRTFGQLYNFDIDLYEYAIKEFFGTGAVEYEEVDDTKKLDPVDTRKKAISDNESRNKKILETLKKKIKL